GIALDSGRAISERLTPPTRTDRSGERRLWRRLPSRASPTARFQSLSPQSKSSSGFQSFRHAGLLTVQAAGAKQIRTFPGALGAWQRSLAPPVRERPAAPRTAAMSELP